MKPDRQTNRSPIKKAAANAAAKARRGSRSNKSTSVNTGDESKKYASNHLDSVANGVGLSSPSVHAFRPFAVKARQE